MSGASSSKGTQLPTFNPGNLGSGASSAVQGSPFVQAAMGGQSGVTLPAGSWTPPQGMSSQNSNAYNGLAIPPGGLPMLPAQSLGFLAQNGVMPQQFNPGLYQGGAQGLAQQGVGQQTLASSGNATPQGQNYFNPQGFNPQQPGSAYGSIMSGLSNLRNMMPAGGK